MERPTKSPPRPRAARGARSGSALRLAIPPAPGPAPRALQVTRRRIPALPAAPATAATATATAGALAATQPQGSGERRSRCVRGAGRGRGPESSSSDPELGNAARPRAPAFGIPGEPGEPRLGAGRGESGFPGPDRGDSPDLGRRRDLTRATLGTLGCHRRRHTPGAMGIPTQGRELRARSSTSYRGDGPRTRASAR